MFCGITGFGVIMFLSFISPFCTSRCEQAKQQQSSHRGWRGVRALKGLHGSAALLDQEMCGHSKMRSKEMSDARRLQK